jgi:2',3'-cyclic-nucleotide 2'-phosphodiesterase/3'-nucleotidase
MRRFFIFIAFLLLAVGCSRTPEPAPVEIEILVTTDLHGHLEHSAADDNSGGWLRLATLIRRERAAFGGDRTLLVDCGDTTQGTFDAAASKGETGILALKMLAYDGWVPGNHELDYGVPCLREFIVATQGIGLAGNLELADSANRDAEAAPTLPSDSTVTQPDRHTATSVAPGFHRPPAWKLIERGGVRVAVIGVTASYMDQWFFGKAADGCRVEKALATVARVLPEIHRARPDVIVLAAHQGWLPNDVRGVNELAEIARRFPEIDIILGGHTHQPFPGKKIAPRTWYLQADCNASALGVLKVKVDTAKHAVLDVQSELRAAGADVPPDQMLAAATRPFREQAARLARQKVGTVAHAVSGEGVPGADCETAALIGRAMMEAVGARAALHGKFTDGGLSAGTVTEFDLYRLLPFENSIVTAWLTPAEILAVMEEQDKVAHERGASTRNGLCGLRITLAADSRSPTVRDGKNPRAKRRCNVVFLSKLFLEKILSAVILKSFLVFINS